jgi:hypothetical protein
MDLQYVLYWILRLHQRCHSTILRVALTGMAQPVALLLSVIQLPPYVRSQRDPSLPMLQALSAALKDSLQDLVTSADCYVLLLFSMRASPLVRSAASVSIALP